MTTCLAQVGSHEAILLDWFDTSVMVKNTLERDSNFMGTCLRTMHNNLEIDSFKKVVQYPVMKKHELGSDSYSRRKQIRKAMH